MALAFCAEAFASELFLLEVRLEPGFLEQSARAPSSQPTLLGQESRVKAGDLGESCVKAGGYSVPWSERVLLMQSLWHFGVLSLPISRVPFMNLCHRS